MKYNYINARPGAGKTTWVVTEFASRNLKYGKNCLMVVPTIRLCDEVVELSGGRFKSIHSENSYGNVLADIKTVFEERLTGEALVITEASFLMLSTRIIPDNWIVIKDEASEPLQIHTIHCPDSRDLLTKWLNLEDVKADKNYKTLFKASSFNDECIKTSTINDGITGVLHQLQKCVQNPHLEVMIDTSRLDWKVPQLVYSVFTKPSLYEGFDQAYFMAANFQHTFLYQQWLHNGVQWVDKTPDQLKETANTSRVRLHYWSENGKWSRRRREKPGQLQNYIKWVCEKLPGDDYIYVLNEHDIANKEYRFLKGERIPAVCHGLNKWRHMTKFVCFASYLISQHEEPFYQYYGTTTNDARMLRNTQMLYQQITRTDLRNKNSDKIIDIYLPTLSEVLELLPYMPQAQVVDICKTKDGESTDFKGMLRNEWSCDTTVVQMSSSELVASYALGANTKVLTAACFTGEKLLKASVSRKRFERYLGETHIGNILLPPSFSPSYEKKDASKKSWYAYRKINPLIAYLKKCAQLDITGKTSEQIKEMKHNNLEFFITGILVDGARFMQASILGNNDVIAFDFDDTQLNLRDISSIFCGIEYLLYTSISHNKNAEVSRYRVVVPCSRVMTKSEHERIMDYWKKEIQKYSKKRGKTSGLDEGCLKPERKFYVPHLKSTIKHVYEGKKELNVDELLSRIPRASIVNNPKISDLEIHSNSTSNKVTDWIHPKIVALIDGMVPGDRSDRTVRVGGIMKRQSLSHNQQENIFNMMRHRGASNEAIHQARKYSGWNR